MLKICSSENRKYSERFILRVSESPLICIDVDGIPFEELFSILRETVLIEAMLRSLPTPNYIVEDNPNSAF